MEPAAETPPISHYSILSHKEKPLPPSSLHVIGGSILCLCVSAGFYGYGEVTDHWQYKVVSGCIAAAAISSIALVCLINSYKSKISAQPLWEVTFREV